MCGLDIRVSGPPLLLGTGFLRPRTEGQPDGRLGGVPSAAGLVSLSSGCWGAVAHPPPVQWAARRGPRWVGLDVIYPARRAPARFFNCELLGVNRGCLDCCGGCALIICGCASVCRWVHLSVVSATNAHANVMRLQMSLVDDLAGRCDSLLPAGGRCSHCGFFARGAKPPTPRWQSFTHPAGMRRRRCCGVGGGDGAARAAAKHNPPPPARGS